MREQNGKQNISSILVLLLFAGFAVCILAVLLTGAETYQSLTKRDQASFDRRTAAQYITTKVRQNDGDGMLFVGDFEDELPDVQGNTLYLVEYADGEAYYTRLYCYDGYIWELYASPGGEFAFEDGEKILPAERVWFSMEDGIVTVELEHTGGVLERFALALRSGEVAA